MESDVNKKRGRGRPRKSQDGADRMDMSSLGFGSPIAQANAVENSNGSGGAGGNFIFLFTID